MRPVSRIRKALSARRLSAKWLAAALITAVVALLASGIGHATASQSHLSSQFSPMAATCTGRTPAVFPAQGFVTDPTHTQGGHLWWRPEPGASVCIGTVVEQLWYTTAATKTWKVIIYSAQHPGGQTITSATFTLRPGFYFWTFRIRHAFPGLSAICVTADQSFGKPCIQIP